MLILSRKVGEQIVIGRDIIITVVAISRDKVRLGIDAPKDMTVHRQEVYEAVQRGRERNKRGGSCPEVRSRQ